MLTLVAALTPTLLFSPELGARQVSRALASPQMLASDLLPLQDLRQELRSALGAPETIEGPVAARIMQVNDNELLPTLPKLYLPSLGADERRAAIEDLSRSLDVVEENVRGPLLAGSEPSLADAALLPSIIVCERTLPQYFGWTEWTDEAMFFRRPRLHAWWELISYEKAARQAVERVSERLEAIDWQAVAIDCPTSKIRDFPKHSQ